MITVRKAKERGHNDLGWLNTYHTFSFDTYYDNRYMNFRSLRVMNEDIIQPGQGFGMHPHKDMEIITYVISGELEHKDSMGTGSVIRPGDVQKMSAGTGILHSEFNHSKENLVHLYQIWIRPDEKGLRPYYEQMNYTDEQKHNRLCLVACDSASDGIITIHQNAKLYASVIDQGFELSHTVDPARHIWVQVIKGELDLNGTVLSQSDGAAVTEESDLGIKALENSEILVFDLE